jgi:hypothetical protein
MHDGPLFSMAPENQDGEKKAPSITLSQLRLLIKLLLSMEKQTMESLIQQVVWIQNRNHKAYLFHRKRRESEYGQYI